MATILKIDTSDNKKMRIGIEINKQIKNEIYVASKILKSEAALPAIDKILKENNLKINDLDGVYVNVNAGSYTGIRVGVAIANALGFLLKIPVNGKKIGDLAKPSYTK